MISMARHAASSDDEPVARAAPIFAPLSRAHLNIAQQTTEPVPPVAPVDAPAEAPAEAVPVREPGSRPLPRPRGRHSHPDEEDDGDIAGPAKRKGATAADLRLLRSDSSLRSRVVSAVVLPFLLYFCVLWAIGRLDAFAVWVWLPLITAGLGAGLLLDAAHAKAKRSGTAES
jgi:hypothetical protein